MSQGLNSVPSILGERTPELTSELPEGCDYDNSGVHGTVFKLAPTVILYPEESAICEGELSSYR